MKTLLVNKMKVVFIHYQTSGGYTVSGFLIKWKGGRISIVGKTAGNEALDGKNELTLMIASGYGVICKNRRTDSGVVDKVMGDPEMFYYNDVPGTEEILFIRKEQLAPFHQWMAGRKAILLPLRLVSGSEEVDNRLIIRLAADVLEQEARFTSFFHPTTAGMAVAASVYKKTRVFLLAFVFLVLIINTLISKNIEEEYNRQNSRMMELQKKAGEQENISRQKQAALNIFKKQLPWRISMLCDCIAADVPERVILLQLSVQPCKKKPENKKEPQFDENMLDIMAETDTTEGVMDFVNMLRQESFAREVNLASVKQDKAAGRFVFYMEVLL